MKLKLSLSASYAIWPGYGFGLFYSFWDLQTADTNALSDN